MAKKDQAEEATPVEAPADTGVSEDAELPQTKTVTLLFFSNGLRAQVLDDITSKVKKAAKGGGTEWVKCKGLNGDNDVFIYGPDVRMMEVTEATIRAAEPAPGQVDSNAGRPEFRPVDLKR